jgi:hypothetical protein
LLELVKDVPIFILPTWFATSGRIIVYGYNTIGLIMWQTAFYFNATFSNDLFPPKTLFAQNH